eukprot:5682914-Prymnesium_polylepis.1
MEVPQVLRLLLLTAVRRAQDEYEVVLDQELAELGRQRMRGRCCASHTPQPSRSVHLDHLPVDGGCRAGSEPREVDRGTGGDSEAGQGLASADGATNHAGGVGRVFATNTFAAVLRPASDGALRPALAVTAIAVRLVIALHLIKGDHAVLLPRNP